MINLCKASSKPLHSKEITKIAIKKGLKTVGKTPEATMSAQLIVDINSNKEKSLFIKTAPNTFAINSNLNVKQQEVKAKEEKKYQISKDISSLQKGNIAEARITELVTLYGSSTLACYKPISDDNGIDLIVKKKENLEIFYVQIKSRFGDNPNAIYTSTVKARTVKNHYSMALIFCHFDVQKGDLWDYVWFIPAPEFLKMANKLKGGLELGFVAGRKKKESNKWDEFLVDKKDLANVILKQMDLVK